jgi:DNA (cytosine-5)-methyltransferase 1
MTTGNAFLDLLASWDIEDAEQARKSKRWRDKFVSVDLFAGAGGASEGIVLATGSHPIVAINHDVAAIAVHKLNHPDTVHFRKPILKVDPRKAVRPGIPVDLLWASPDCRHYSRMTGGSKRDEEVRALPRVVPKWMKALQPRVVAVENVAEMQGWGPLDRSGRPVPALKGTEFKLWIQSMKELGYAVDWRVLDAADYGAPTARRRLFVVATREGKPKWPKPTHGPGRKKPYHTALEIIDPAIPAPSVLDAKIKSDPVKMRIVRALVKWTQENKPVLARVGSKTYALALIPVGFGERTTGARRQALRTQDIRQPIGTIVAGGVKHALAMFELGSRPRQGIDAWVRRWGGPPGLRVGGMHVTDIRFRRLVPEELKLGQGLPADYVLRGTNAKKVHLIGNSVPPQAVAAVIRAQFPELR